MIEVLFGLNTLWIERILDGDRVTSQAKEWEKIHYFVRCKVQVGYIETLLASSTLPHRAYSQLFKITAFIT